MDCLTLILKMSYLIPQTLNKVMIMSLPWWLFVHSGSVLLLYIIDVVHNIYTRGVKESSVCVVIKATHTEFKLATQSIKHCCE